MTVEEPQQVRRRRTMYHFFWMINSLPLSLFIVVKGKIKQVSQSTSTACRGSLSMMPSGTCVHFNNNTARLRKNRTNRKKSKLPLSLCVCLSLSFFLSLFLSLSLSLSLFLSLSFFLSFSFSLSPLLYSFFDRFPSTIDNVFGNLLFFNQFPSNRLPRFLSHLLITSFATDGWVSVACHRPSV